MHFRLKPNHLAAGFAALYFLNRFFFMPPDNVVETQNQPAIMKYKGTTWRSDRTVSVRTVAETSFARCDIHTVASEDGLMVFNDWIFLEEVNAVNIVVQTVEGKFVVFKQRKYAVPGVTFSPVGGFVDDGEHPWTSAKREVLEELGLGSSATLARVNRSFGNRDDQGQMETKRRRNVIKDIIIRDAAPPVFDEFNIPDGQLPSSNSDLDWVFLGRYRTAVNRGGGFTYLYLLKNAVPLLPNGGSESYSGTGDDEQQEVMHLSVDEVFDLLSQAKFQEIKWTATFALSLMHINNNMPACCGGQ
jgi:8-oxo-dGTP pyrophosphatase MutT (NUDIX family)